MAQMRFVRKGGGITAHPDGREEGGARVESFAPQAGPLRVREEGWRDYGSNRWAGKKVTLGSNRLRPKRVRYLINSRDRTAPQSFCSGYSSLTQVTSSHLFYSLGTF